MQDIVIFGTGGFAREVHQLIEDINAAAPQWRCLGFLDGDATRHGQQIHGLPVLGGPEFMAGAAGAQAQLVIAVGNPAVRRKIAAAIGAAGHGRFATLIHPRAWVGNRVAVGQGTMLCAGVLVTTDIAIGEHAIINIGSTVGHDARIGNFVTIAPTVNVSGAVEVGEGVDLGTGSTVIQGKRIGAWSIVGAGSVVVKDIEPNVTVVGAPAKMIKSRDSGWHLE
jgi:sugar O-acyltransferase (sialic acid O-acetyltransferase NeuD family)